VYVAGVASAVVARTSATFPSKKALYSVTLIKSDAETRPRHIRASTDRLRFSGQLRSASIFCVQKFSRFCRTRMWYARRCVSRPRGLVGRTTGATSSAFKPSYSSLEDATVHSRRRMHVSDGR